MKRLIFLFVFLNFAFAKAQSLQDFIPQVEEQPRRIVDTLNRDYDDRAISSRATKEQLSEQYTGEDFDYNETTAERTENSIARYIRDFFNWLERKFGFTISPFWRGFIKYTIYVLMGIAVLYFIIRMLTDESPTKIFTKTKKELGQVNIDEAHIEEIDLSKYISDSIAAGNYRNAVRYLYLDSLKKLNQKGKIDWDYQKTNADYSRELQELDLKNQFKKASYLYDYVWYGEFAIDYPSFEKASKEFTTLNNMIA